MISIFMIWSYLNLLVRNNIVNLDMTRRLTKPNGANTTLEVWFGRNAIFTTRMLGKLTLKAWKGVLQPKQPSLRNSMPRGVLGGFFVFVKGLRFPGIRGIGGDDHFVVVCDQAVSFLLVGIWGPPCGWFLFIPAFTGLFRGVLGH